MKRAPLNQNAILNALRGQTLRIPSLTPIFRNWPAAQPNPHYRSAIPLVNQAIDRIAATQPLIAKRRNDDIALMTALWYPLAERRLLHALSLFNVWLVCWDDCVDANEGGLAADFDLAQEWRAESLCFVRECLGVGGFRHEGQVDAFNGVLQDFGRHFSSSPVAQRERLSREIQFFMECCGTEQRLRLEKFIPDYGSYISFRLGTVGGRILCSLIEFANSEELPASVINSPLRMELWNQVCVLLSLVNDMLSLKKELASDCVINAVTALLSPEKNLDMVIQELMEKLIEAFDEFDQAAEGLLELVKDDTRQTEAVRRHIHTSRAIVTGLLEFSLKSPRYKLSKLIRDDGSLELVL